LEHRNGREQVRFILATGKRIRDHMVRVQTELIAQDPGASGFGDMTMAQTSAVLMTMDRGSVGVSELAALLGVSAPSASSMIDRLVEKGVLAREPCREDRRKMVVTVALRAKAYFAKVQSGMQDAVNRLAVGLGPETTQKWYEVMQRVSKVLDGEERKLSDE